MVGPRHPLYYDYKTPIDLTRYVTFALGLTVTRLAKTYAASLTIIPATDGGDVKVTLTGNITVTLDGTGLVEGSIFTLSLIQDGTGGRTTAWGGSNISWGTAGAPTLTTTLNKTTIITFLWDGSKFNGALFGTGF